jgi:hypothetical protein
MKHLLLAAVAATAVLGCASVRAGEITLIAPGGIRAAIDQMIPDFEGGLAARRGRQDTRTGIGLRVPVTLTSETTKRIARKTERSGAAKPWPNRNRAQGPAAAMSQRSVYR